MRDKTEISPKYLTVFRLLYWQVKYHHRLKNVRYFGLDRNLRYLVKCYEATHMNVQYICTAKPVLDLCVQV